MKCCIFVVNKWFKMANRLTRKEIGALIGRSQNYVGIYVKRGKLIEKDGLIDTDDTFNKEWITKMTAKSLEEAKEKPIPKAKSKPRPRKKTQTDISDDFEFDEVPVEKLPVRTIDALKKKKEIKKIEIQTKKEELEYLKKKEKVLPIEFVIDWAARNMRGVFGETINFGNTLIESICNDLGADTEIKLQYKKKFKQGFQEVLQLGIKKQEPESIEFAKEYSLMNKW